MAREGKVAKVLTGRDVALSGGKDIGVQTGDIAVVYRVHDVPDPDKGVESLGEARLNLVRLRIFQVGDRFSVGRTDDSVRAGSFPESILQSREHVKVTDEPGKERHGVVAIQPGDLVEYTTPGSQPDK